MELKEFITVSKNKELILFEDIIKASELTESQESLQELSTVLSGNRLQIVDLGDYINLNIHLDRLNTEEQLQIEEFMDSFDDYLRYKEQYQNDNYICFMNLGLTINEENFNSSVSFMAPIFWALDARKNEFKIVFSADTIFIN